MATPATSSISKFCPSLNEGKEILSIITPTVFGIGTLGAISSVDVSTMRADRLRLVKDDEANTEMEMEMEMEWLEAVRREHMKESVASRREFWRLNRKERREEV